MRVSFLTFDEKLASARYRQHIPIRELRKLGYEIGPDGDVLVCSKHGWPEELADAYERVIFDVCDDHFGGKLGDWYRKICDKADLIVCNSDAMRFRIWQETQRVATVIPDPYEFELRAPSWGEGLLWFGHESNLPDLGKIVPTLGPYKLQIVSKPVVEGITPWTKENLAEALQGCSVVILPTGKSACKSANRMIESIRSGKFVVANPLPAYEDFYGAWVGDIREGVDWAYAHQEDALDRVAVSQKEDLAPFAPERIGKLWAAALEAVNRTRQSEPLLTEVRS